MQVDESHTAGRTEHGGRSYYFCSTGCLAKFRADSAAYVAKDAAAAGDQHGHAHWVAPNTAGVGPPRALLDDRQ
jgi:Cu+-exporting ATPase